LLIEVDGIFWHCRNDVKKKPSDWMHRVFNDIYKNELALERGFKLVRIWEDEIDKVWKIID